MIMAALKHIYDELKETQRHCREDYEALCALDCGGQDDNASLSAAPSDNEAAGLESLRVLYHRMADECRGMIKSVQSDTATHHSQCREQLDTLDRDMEEMDAMMGDLEHLMEQKGRDLSREKHVTALRMLQRLVRETAATSKARELIDAAKESQRLLSEKQKVLREHTQAFEESLSLLRLKQGDDAEVRTLRAENAQYRAELEEAKRREKEISESLMRMKETTQRLNEDMVRQREEQRENTELLSSISELRVMTTTLEEQRDSAIREREDIVRSLEQEQRRVRELEADMQNTKSQLDSQRHTLDGVAETFRRIVNQGKGKGTHYRDLSALQRQALDVAEKLAKRIVDLESSFTGPVAPGREVDALMARARELNEENERLKADNAGLRQDIEFLTRGVPNTNTWNGAVSSGPFAYPHTMLFLPRPDCDGVYEAYNRGHPGYFLSDEISSEFRDQIRNSEPILATLLLNPEAHTAEAGNKYKLAPGTRYWTCTCAAVTHSV